MQNLCAREPLARVAIAALLLIAAFAQPAAAQAAAGSKWEVEFHAGAILASNPSDGTANVPGSAEQFITGVNCATCPVSRRVSSWYFGDGPALVNQVSESAPFFITRRLTALDPVLSAMLTKRQNGGGFGFRLGRVLTPRLTAELNVDYHAAPLEITSDAAAGIEASRAAFLAAFTQLQTTGPFLQPSVTSTAEIHDGSGSQLMTTAAVTFDLMTTGNFIPYVTGGAGILSNTGSAPSATLAGAYQFMWLNMFPFSESDKVTVHDDRPDRSFVGVFGGGVRWHAAQRWGIRVDVRDHVNQNNAATLVDATPQTQSAVPQLVFFSGTTPSIQFSNAPNLARSTLSGPRLEGLQTFKAKGMQNQISITSGIFWRF